VKRKTSNQWDVMERGEPDPGPIAVEQEWRRVVSVDIRLFMLFVLVLLNLLSTLTVLVVVLR